MTRIIEIDCEKWQDRFALFGIITLNILLYVGWGLITFFGLFLYVLISEHLSEINDLVALAAALVVLTLLNGINWYFILREIYNHQKLFKFKCVSKIENKTESKENFRYDE